MRTHKKQRRVQSSSTIACVPERKTAVFHVPGPHGGWFIDLLWNFGHEVSVPWEELRDIVRVRDGSIVIARRLTAAETQFLEESRADGDHYVHARVVNREARRWRR